jgi:replicative DNA helicase
VLGNAFHAGTDADALTIIDDLDRMGVLEDAGGKSYIVELTKNAMVAAVAQHARIVVEHAEARALIHLAENLDRLARLVQVDEAHALIEEALAKIGSTDVRAVKLADTLAAYVDVLEARKNGGDILGVPTGWADLDALLGGMRGGQSICIASRPSVGKSALAIGLAMHTASLQIPTLVVSLEMAVEELQDRYLSSASGVDSKILRNGHWGMFEWQKMTDHLGRLSKLPLYIYDDASATVASIHAASRSVPNCGLVIVDYLQLVSGPARRNESRQAEVADVSRGLKITARHINAPVVALAQLNRQLELRSDKRPILADLRESGAIEADSDIVIGLYRDELYTPDSDDKGVIELILLKNRAGPLGTVKLGYDKALHRMTDLAKGF